MADTEIEWATKVWNFTRGCGRVSSGCVNCYAERQAIRHSTRPGAPYAGLVKHHRDGPRWTGDVRFVAEKLAEPLHWKQPRDGSRHRIFVNSMSDLFHEGFTNEQIAAGFGVMAACPQHDFLILTKRAKRMREWFEWAHGDPLVAMTKALGEHGFGRDVIRRAAYREPRDQAQSWPLPNVWLGCSAEDQQRADERIPLLLQCPAAVRWVSAEPLLGPIDFTRLGHNAVNRNALTGMLDGPGGTTLTRDQVPGLDWIVVGGESGPGARPCDVRWVRSIVRQCCDAGVPAFCKQLGAHVLDANDTNYDGVDNQEGLDAWPYGTEVEDFWNDPNRRHQGAAVRFLLDDRKGGEPEEWPSDLRVREWPEVRA